MTALGQGTDDGLRADQVMSSHHDVGMPRRGRPPVGRRRLRRQHDRPGVPGRLGEQPALRIQVERARDDGDGRGRRTALAKLSPGLRVPHRAIALCPDGARAGQDHVGEAAEHREDLPVRLAGETARLSLRGGGAVNARDHVGAHPRAARRRADRRIRVEPGDLGQARPAGLDRPDRAVASFSREDLAHASSQSDRRPFTPRRAQAVRADVGAEASVARTMLP